MARLNEPPAPTETIESLKRKFMRQNRDIARANSTQSLRIRNLENETSKLLAENLDLREQIIQLQNELQNGRAQRIEEHTGALKSQLEAKLVELGALITSLGNEPIPKKSPKAGKITRTSPSNSPDQRNWKNMCTLSEAVTGQDARLPVILENKSYPRRTLEREELLSIAPDAAADSTDSPEIGPPPVSQFVEDPVKIDLPTRARPADNEELSSLDPALSINLEQRKKRKDSIISPDSRRGSKAEPTQGARESTGSLKTGAKRKFSVRDADEQEVIAKQVDDSPGDFMFTRGVSEERSRTKPATQPDNSTTKPLRDMAVAKGAAPRDNASGTYASSVRKVLAPKSVNASPRKSKGPFLDGIKAAKADVAKLVLPKDPREKKQDTFSTMSSVEPVTSTVEIQAEPETPARLDLFSPFSSQASTARAESRDTPPPPELGPGTEGQRPSRRARGAVSYAEPNLRDKMRRPTKDLADAVGAETKRNGLLKIDDDGSSTGIQVKPEPEAEYAWKTMPIASSSTIESSPLNSKVSVADSLPSSITTHRKRRESIFHGTEPELPQSGSGSAMAALLASSRKAKAEALEKARGDVQPKAEGDLDIYEFRGSSPAPAEDIAGKPSKEGKPVSRFSRRYSAIGKDSTPAEDSEASDMEAPRKVEASSSRRRQSTLGVRSSSSASNVSAKDDEGEKISLRRSATTRAIADVTAGGSRSDRIAARRRSMML